MKKTLKTLLIILLLCPILLLAACKAKESYLISALSSDPYLGEVSGVNNQLEQVEGTKITLKANSDKNLFICWIKDYKKVVSNESSLNLTYNKKNAGHYTALFEEQDINKMAFVYLKSLDIETEEFVSASYQIESALIASGSNNFSLFTEGNLNIGNEQIADTKNVLYLGGMGTLNEFKFNLKITLSNANNETTDINVEFNKLLNKNGFDEEGRCALSVEKEYEVDKTIQFTLNFEKITSQIYNN